jgi:holo-[acyl-carrier protein] synthase
VILLGLGSDLIDIRRVEKVLERYGDRFIDRVFTPVERAKAERRTERIRAATYAKRYAAKEACSKALGTGFRAGVYWRDIGVVNLPSGRPTLALTGGAKARLERMTPPGMVAEIHLTLTDEPPLAQAMVMIVAVPAAVADGAAKAPS